MCNWLAGKLKLLCTQRCILSLHGPLRRLLKQQQFTHNITHTAHIGRSLSHYECMFCYFVALRNCLAVWRLSNALIACTNTPHNSPCSSGESTGALIHFGQRANEPGKYTRAHFIRFRCTSYNEQCPAVRSLTGNYLSIRRKWFVRPVRADVVLKSYGIDTSDGFFNLR